MNYLQKYSLEGKTAWIVGGCGLIGSEITLAFVSAGAKVIILDIDKKKGKEFTEKDDVEFELFDATKTIELKSSIGRIWQKKRADILVNTAYPRTLDWANKLEDVKAESWNANIQMHLNSYCLVSSYIAELMQKSQIHGSIVNLGSIYGVVAPDFSIYDGTPMTSPAPYTAIKGGIIAFTKYLASYFGKHGIRVNVVSPGGVYDNQNQKFVDRYNKKTSLNRMCSQDEVASAVLFLASEAASYITGINLLVDGGWVSK